VTSLTVAVPGGVGPAVTVGVFVGFGVGGVSGSGTVVVADTGNDRIVVLEDGGIAGIGTHEELMRTCETYREIVLSQLSAEEAA